MLLLFHISYYIFTAEAAGVDTGVTSSNSFQLSAAKYQQISLSSVLIALSLRRTTVLALNLKSLGAIFDQRMNFDKHMIHLSWTLFFHL